MMETKVTGAEKIGGKIFVHVENAKSGNSQTVFVFGSTVKRYVPTVQ